MTYIAVALLCLAVVNISLADDNINNYVSPEEIKSYLNCDVVPKYEIVKIDCPERLHKRDLSEGSKMHIRAFGRNINLWLHPRDNVLAGYDLPVYYARYSPWAPLGVDFVRRDGLMDMVGRLFEDPYTMASLVIGKEPSGRARINGFIGSERMAVKPLPSRIIQNYTRTRRSPGVRDDVEEPFHIIYETNVTHGDNDNKFPASDSILGLREMLIESRIPDVIYPETLVVVEHTLYKDYDRNTYGLLEYLLAFWNGVDLKYRSMESPRVRFHIAGIIVGVDYEATPYISKNNVGVDTFNSSEAMKDMSYFHYAIKETFPLDSYDISVTMTKQIFGLDDESRVLGKAWIGLACVYYDDFKIRYGVALVQDNGGFGGVSTASHEIGHLLGARHDVSKDGCSYSNGFIMSFSPSWTKNSSDFSSCSLANIDDFFKKRKLDCMFNRPRTMARRLPKLMPGRVKNLEEQCRIQGYGPPCQPENDEADVCVNIRCRNPYGDCSETGIAAADGTSCDGGDKFCLHMQCVGLQ